jgi:hypothetical protein
MEMLAPQIPQDDVHTRAPKDTPSQRQGRQTGLDGINGMNHQPGPHLDQCHVVLVVMSRRGHVMSLFMPCHAAEQPTPRAIGFCAALPQIRW